MYNLLLVLSSSAAAAATITTTTNNNAIHRLLKYGKSCFKGDLQCSFLVVPDSYHVLYSNRNRRLQMFFQGSQC